MSYKAPDRKAPRFRKSRVSVLNTKFYREFKRRFPQYKDVPNKKLGDIIRTYNEQLLSIAIENRDGVELPENLGFNFIGACPPSKKVNIDHKKSAEYGKIVRHRNFDSDNKLAKIFYTNYHHKYRFVLREIWKFVPSRNFSLAASAAFRTSWQKYLKIENLANISKALTKDKHKVYATTIGSEIPDSYNEFALD